MSALKNQQSQPHQNAASSCSDGNKNKEDESIVPSSAYDSSSEFQLVPFKNAARQPPTKSAYQKMLQSQRTKNPAIPQLGNYDKKTPTGSSVTSNIENSDPLSQNRSSVGGSSLKQDEFNVFPFRAICSGRFSFSNALFGIAALLIGPRFSSL